MYYSNEESFKQMLTLLDKTEQLRAQLLDVANEMEKIRTSSIADLVPFPKASWRSAKGHSAYKYSLSELEELIEMKPLIETLLTQTKTIENSDFNIEIGDVLKAKLPIYTSIKNNQYVLDASGTERYQAGCYFLVLDKLDSMNYVLISKGKSASWYDDRIMHATKSQIEVLMNITNEVGPDKDWFKFEFSLNGPDPIKYAPYFKSIKIFEDACKDRYKSEFNYDYDYVNETELLIISADEVFGIMGTCYFCGSIKDKYKSFILRFENLETNLKQRNRNSKDTMKIGFHLKEGSKDTYEYDSNISYFVPGNFPKDVFVGGSKQRVINLLEVTPLVSKYKEVKANVCN
ncbi:MAG: hypothetical protein K0R18_286 [Bacillales bacterium]|nr:hypothetical protein [Bacillales bacterium]